MEETRRGVREDGRDGRDAVGRERENRLDRRRQGVRSRRGGRWKV